MVRLFIWLLVIFMGLFMVEKAMGYSEIEAFVIALAITLSAVIGALVAAFVLGRR